MNDVPKWMWEDDHSAFRDLVGYGPVAWREFYVELALDLDVRHRNRSGIAHGGVIATLLDAAIFERRATVRAVRIEHTDAAPRVAERDQVLGHDANPLRQLAELVR